MILLHELWTRGKAIFLDHELVNLINSLPTEMKFNLTKRKIMAHRVLSKISNFKAKKKNIPPNPIPIKLQEIRENYLFFLKTIDMVF